MNVGQAIQLRRDNLNGVGNKGDTGFVKDLLYKPMDGWEVLVKLSNGGTEGFMFEDLEKQIKHLTRVSK